ncbi:MAG: hypothetical protein P4L92_00120 [Rudaea sp.]|nr:hypothetical protein [Rudaea sp.]
MNKAIPKTLASAVRALAQDRQGQLSMGVALPDGCNDDGSSLPLGRLLKVYLQRQAQISTYGREAVVAAATATLGAWNQQILRQVAQQLSGRDRRDATPALDAASAACAANVPQAVAQFLGEAAAPPRRSRKRFDPDNDLSVVS